MYMYIRSMSEYQNKIYDNLTSASKQIDLHIIKLLLYPQSSYKDHWMHEIWSFLHDIDKMKLTHKYPKVSFIKKALAVHNDVIDNYIKIIISEEVELDPVAFDVGRIIDIIEDYQSWLAIQLSNYGVVVQKEVKDYLNHLITR